MRKAPSEKTVDKVCSHSYVARGLSRRSRNRGGSEGIPLEAPALGKQKQLPPRPLSADSRGLMLKRRLKDASLPPILSPHSFRVEKALCLACTRKSLPN